MADSIDALYVSIDALRLDEVLAHFARDGAVVFANNPPAVGHQAIGEALGSFWSLISSIRHEVHNRWDVNSGTSVLEADVHYATRGGTEFTVPCVTVINRDSADLVTSLRVHIDVNALVAAALTELADESLDPTP
jgi:hypothetical protein